MRVFGIGDLHLSLGRPKPMERFGPGWAGHPERLEAAWRARVHPSDLVLIPGDISWAMKLEDALPDLAFIDALPGRKVMIPRRDEGPWAVPRLPPWLWTALRDSSRSRWRNATTRFWW